MLPITLVLVVIFGAVAVGIANHATASLRSDGVMAERYERLVAVEGAMRIVLEDVRVGTKTCGTAATNVLTTTIEDNGVSVSCIREAPTMGANGPIGLALTSEGLSGSTSSLEIEEDNSRVAGNVYFSRAPSALDKTLFVENGDVWFGSGNCATATAPNIAKLTIVTAERGYLCATNKWEQLFATPVPGTVPSGTNPAPNTTAVPGCTIYFPGTYTSRPSLSEAGEVYFASGLYYFNGVGTMTIRNTTVVAGTPGSSPIAETDTPLDMGACAAAPSNPVVTARSSGTGATFVLGGSSRFKMENKAFMEIFAPAGRDSLIAFHKTVPGFARSSVSVSDPLIEQVHQNSEFTVHGRIWAPGSFLRIGNYVRNVDPEGNLVLGGAVLARLELVEAPPSTGYNLQVPTVEVKYRIQVTATTPGTQLRVVATVRRSSDELAVNSWSIENPPV